eukprot:scpid83956/ scgid30337/ 
MTERPTARRYREALRIYGNKTSPTRRIATTAMSHGMPAPGLSVLRLLPPELCEYSMMKKPDGIWSDGACNVVLLVLSEEAAVEWVSCSEVTDALVRCGGLSKSAATG